jgi:hypothetical protein
MATSRGRVAHLRAGTHNGEVLDVWALKNIADTACSMQGYPHLAVRRSVLAVVARSEPNVTRTGIGPAPCSRAWAAAARLARAFEASDPLMQLKCACRSS